jgi:hypothetical protein
MKAVRRKWKGIVKKILLLKHNSVSHMNPAPMSQSRKKMRNTMKVGNLTVRSRANFQSP